MSSQVFELPRRGLKARQSETVEKLLAAALEELRAVGHEALTVRNVAQRAGVSPATAYTYLASKNHLFAELFWRHLASDPDALTTRAGRLPVRMEQAIRALVGRIVQEPELAAAVTPALLGADPDVDRLRLRIGAEFVSRIEAALGDGGGDQRAEIVETLTMTISGALLQVGMGLISYDAMADRLAAAVRVILKGHR